MSVRWRLTCLVCGETGVDLVKMQEHVAGHFDVPAYVFWKSRTIKRHPGAQADPKGTAHEYVWTDGADPLMRADLSK